MDCSVQFHELGMKKQELSVHSNTLIRYSDTSGHLKNKPDQEVSCTSTPYRTMRNKSDGALNL